MTFYQARQRLVRAVQWTKHGDHEAVQPGVRAESGVLDAAQAEPFSRRFIEPGDWLVRSNSGKLHVLTPAEFDMQYEGV